MQQPLCHRKAQNGVMMHLADEAQPSELVVKGGPGGKNYIGPPGPALHSRIAKFFRSVKIR